MLVSVLVLRFYAALFQGATTVALMPAALAIGVAPINSRGFFCCSKCTVRTSKLTLRYWQRLRWMTQAQRVSVSTYSTTHSSFLVWQQSVLR